MKSIRASMSTMNEWLREIFQFGLSMIMVFVIVDILFPHTTGVIDNIGALVATLSDKGVAGFIALLIFLAINKR